MVVAFLGVDGSGKSTIIEAFMRHVRSDWPDIQYVHFRPTYLHRGKGEGKPVVDPHSGRQRGVLMSLIKLLYFVVEYNYAFHFHYKKTRDLVIFDRYYYDAIADPKRIKNSAPLGAAKFLSRFIPQPDLTFYLYAPAEVMFERKKEVPIDALIEISSTYMGLTSIADFHKVSTATSVEETLKRVLEVYNKFNGRTVA